MRQSRMFFKMCANWEEDVERNNPLIACIQFFRFKRADFIQAAFKYKILKTPISYRSR